MGADADTGSGRGATAAGMGDRDDDGIGSGSSKSTSCISDSIIFGGSGRPAYSSCSLFGVDGDFVVGTSTARILSAAGEVAGAMTGGGTASVVSGSCAVTVSVSFGWVGFGAGWTGGGVTGAGTTTGGTGFGLTGSGGGTYFVCCRQTWMPTVSRKGSKLSSNKALNRPINGITMVRYLPL